MARTFTKDQLAKAPRLAMSPVYRIDTETVVKLADRMEEAETMRFIRANTTIPVPEVQNAYRDEETGQVVIVMDFIEGQTLKTAWDHLNETDQESIIFQLRNYMAQLRRFKGDYIGSINRTACNDQLVYSDPEKYGPYESEQDFNEGIAKAMKKYNNFGYTDWTCTIWLSAMKNHDIVFTHGDFDPRNILVEGDRVVAILDWEYAGYYPAYWEYCKALLRPDWECSYSRGQTVDKILDPFHQELAVMWIINEVLF